MAWKILSKREPIYAGKPLSAWINSLDMLGFDLEQRASLGSNTIPVLLLALQKRDLSNRFQVEVLYQETWLKVHPKIRWLLPRPPKDPIRIRAGAAFTLIQMGEDARPAIPSLIDLLGSSRDFRVRLSVASALLGLGRGDKAITAAMVEALRDDNWQVRRFAADALKQLDPEAAVKAGIQ